MNQISVIGNLGADPEIKMVGNKQVANFRIAVSGGKDSTMWLGVTAWESQAGIVQRFLRKGSKVGVSGRLVVREYDRKDGSKGTSVEIVASQITLCGGGDHAPAAGDDTSGIPF